MREKKITIFANLFHRKKRYRNSMNVTQQEELSVIVGLATRNQSMERTCEYLDELEFLVHTAGGQVVKRFVQSLDHPDSRTYLGSGKMEEIRAYITEREDIHTIVFDDELSTSQIRNIEAMLPACKVIDRTRLILDIFPHAPKPPMPKFRWSSPNTSICFHG